MRSTHKMYVNHLQMSACRAREYFRSSFVILSRTSYIKSVAQTLLPLSKIYKFSGLHCKRQQYWVNLSEIWQAHIVWEFLENQRYTVSYKIPLSKWLKSMSRVCCASRTAIASVTATRGERMLYAPEYQFHLAFHTRLLPQQIRRKTFS